MASLKEIRGRISSVKGTLKITSAMRMISSAKLHSSMNAIGGMVPYEKEMGSMLSKLVSRCPDAASAMEKYAGSVSDEDGFKARLPERTAVVLVTSNQTLCGAFNANVLKTFAAQGFKSDSTDVYAIGRVGLKSLRKAGFTPADCSAMAVKPEYDASRSLAEKLVGEFIEGKVQKVVLVYTHMVSRSTQIPVVKTYLPFVDEGLQSDKDTTEYIVEPSPSEMLQQLLPLALTLKFHTALLDAAAAEHAARTLAMQMATENAEELIGELSLTYNKLRQQQITNEILDLVGGQVE